MHMAWVTTIYATGDFQMFKGKKSIIGALVLLAPVSAQAGPVWYEVAELVRRCSSQTVCVRPDGSMLAGALTSSCS